MTQAYPACRACKDFDSSKCATCMWQVEYLFFKEHGSWEPEPFVWTHIDIVKAADRVVEDIARSLRYKSV